MRLDVDRRHQKHARREISEANVSDLDLDALEALLKEAPHPGEWKATSGGTLRTDDASIDYPPCVRSHWKDEQERRCQRIIAESDNEADVSLIAALYNAAPELIAEAREARRLREGIVGLRGRLGYRSDSIAQRLYDELGIILRGGPAQEDQPGAT
jgi:hypothetical protein